VSISSPPRLPRPSGLVDPSELEALVEALIEEARQRARRRRHRNAAIVLLAAAIAIGVYAGINGVSAGQQSAAALGSSGALAARPSAVRNGPITLFVAPSANADGLATIESVGKRGTKVIWQCPQAKWCGQPVSFAWSPDGRRVAFSLDEVGGDSSYVGLHVVNVVTSKDTQIPAGAPPSFARKYRKLTTTYLRRMGQRIGCWPPSEIAWSADGSSLAYRCGNGLGSHINVLRLNPSRHTTIPTKTAANWPSWSPAGNRIAYSTALLPTPTSAIYTVGLDGRQAKLLATGGAAPAWSPDGTTIAYQTRCGIRLVTPSGKDVTPPQQLNPCGAIGLSGPPVWAPDGTKIAIETSSGVYTVNAKGGQPQRISSEATTTWYGQLPRRPAWQPLQR